LRESFMLYYDLTDLLKYFERHQEVTGIQRVTVVTIREFLKLAAAGPDAQEFRLLYYKDSEKAFVSTDAGFFADETRTGSDIRAFFNIASKGENPELQAYINARYKSTWRRSLHTRRMKLKNWFTKGKAFRKKGIALSFQPSQIAERVVWSKARFSADDVIFSSGPNWVNAPFLKEIENLRTDAKVKFVQLVYDLIPVRNPEFLPKATITMFEDWLVTLNRCADVLITNASVTRDDLAAFAEAAHLPAFRDIRIVPLAHEFLKARADGSKPAIGENAPYAAVRTPVLHAARLPFALCVGTQEIRKNNWGLAQVWEELKRKRGYDLPRLVFAGRDGWRNDEFKALLKRTDHLGGFILTLNDATDDELAYLYEKCLFSVFPSYAEGWGLPIGESLWFGKPVITSNLSSMPEVAGACADYADPYELRTLETAVEKMLDKTYREMRAATAAAAMPMRTWTHVAADIWRTLRAV
jgi:glycosyltransferase involved in cell wall biosynthesis